MIPQVDKRDVVSSGADDSVSFEISAKDTAHIMTILRDTLYSDKIMAVLREYGTNAWDANKMAGRGDVPIEVTLPTLGKPELVIRDRGPGLSHVDIRRVYTQYGASTKREDNVAAGMLGIGSKSGFAYSDSFTITSWHAEEYPEDFVGPRCGFKRVYIAVIDKSEKGRCDLMHEEACDPSETGVEISVPVKPQDCAAFEERAKRLFVHFQPRPKINCVLPDMPAQRRVGDLGFIDETEGYEGRGRWFAVMGPVAYKIDLGQLWSGEINGQKLTRAASNIGGTLPFDIGILQIAASREHLKYGDSTREALIRRINEIIDEYVVTVLADMDKVSVWEQRLRVRGVERKGLPVPMVYKNRWQYDYVDLQKSMPGSISGAPLVTFSQRNYNERMVAATTLHVQPDTRLVIKDDKRAMSGFELKGSNDIVVSGADIASVQGAAFRQWLKKWTVEKQIDGIPIVLLSSIKWTAPVVKSTGKPRDNVRAKAKHFVLEPTKTFYDDQRAELWTPIERVPAETDVYVVLTSYRVIGMEGFYETYRQDEMLLKRFGLVMPAIYGYKDTQAKPVDPSKLKGKSYRAWRNDDMVKLLMTVPQVNAIVQGSAFESGAGYQNFDMTMMEREFGKDHILYKYAAAETSGRMAWSKATTDQKLAANHIRNSLKEQDLEATKMTKQIYATYPLLTVTGMRAFKEGKTQLWIDYVKLVERDAAAPKQQESKEAA